MFRKKVHRSSGFSLVEAMVAAGILGIALIGLVRMHNSSMKGTVRAASIGQAAEVARQLAETFTVQTYEAIQTTPPGTYPHCLPGINAALPPAPAGCRQTNRQFAPPKADLCTRWSRGGELPSVDGTDAGLGTPNDTFRVDTAISRHPNPIQFPDSFVVTVWVCWRDENLGQQASGLENAEIREVVTSRIVTRGL